jgi:hypothetical protein
MILILVVQWRKCKLYLYVTYVPAGDIGQIHFALKVEVEKICYINTLP